MEFKIEDMPLPGSGFDARGGYVLGLLLKDLAPLKDFQAAGIVGNLGGESGLEAVNEKVPMVQGSRGGFGWEQATGPRRVEFENFSQEKGLDIKSNEANYAFLIHELLGSENAALRALRATQSLEDAVYVFEVKFERPSDPRGGLPSRTRFANRALVSYTKLVNGVTVVNNTNVPAGTSDTQSDAGSGAVQNDEVSAWTDEANQRVINAIKALQVELKAITLYEGEIDGIWGKGSLEAMQNFQSEQ